MPRPERAGQRGSVLLLALWVLIALSVLAVGLAQSARQKVRVFQRIEERQTTRSLCRSAAKALTTRVKELTSQARGDKEDILFGLGEGSMSLPGGTVRYRIFDESSRVQVNACRPQTFRQLLMEAAHLGAEPADRIAYALVDYRDPDDALSVYYDGGSEKELYVRQRLPYPPKNSGLELISELRRIPGITKEIYNSIRDYVTIYGNGKVSINTAPRSVLMALDMPDPLVDKILAVRRGDDNRSGTGDDREFTSLEALRALLRSTFGLTPDEEASLDHAMRHDLSTGGTYYTLLLEAKADRGAAVSKAVCVFAPREGIVYWTES
ncbi:MAG: hypothetical protein MOGMAGMI_00411 [Candidatus Omnitrophica bacterium]|nr:hypothetical protein [Candidatus Omnitrophota bacterium]